MTRKLLVPFEIEDPQKKINDFLYPDFSENKMSLRGIKTGKRMGLWISNSDT